MRDRFEGGRENLGPTAGDGSVGPPTEESGGAVARHVEIVGPHLRITGRLDLGSFHRVTDLVNRSSSVLFHLSDAKVLLNDGQQSSLAVGDLWVSPAEITVIAETESSRDDRPRDVVIVTKTPRELAIVTTGHTLTGRVYTTPHATLEVFLESPDPQYLPMTDLRVRSLINQQIEAEYAFALVNRRHIIAASATHEAPPDPSPSLFDRLR